MSHETGIVHITGAGPGDIKLLTLKALEVIQEADAIVYDRLINSEILNFAKPGTLLIYCGKEPGTPFMTQEEINDHLIRLGKKGLQVVRLKGGDPLIFGRGAEEAQALLQHNVPFEIIPGITSGVAAPAYAGIPLTHRELSASFAVVTAHRRKDDAKDEIHWQSLAHGIDTLVFYMGVKQLPVICSSLLDHGKETTTPVAVIQWGTCDIQRTVTGNLLTIEQIVATEGITSPAIIVVGDVVKIREELVWFESNILGEAAII